VRWPSVQRHPEKSHLQQHGLRHRPTAHRKRQPIGLTINDPALLNHVDCGSRLGTPNFFQSVRLAMQQSGMRQLQKTLATFLRCYCNGRDGLGLVVMYGNTRQPLGNSNDYERETRWR
jgi:hypothetical protein